MALEYMWKEEENEASMSFEIYKEIDKELSPPLKDAISEAESDDEKKMAEKALRETRELWKKLSLAVAKGVVTHIISNMEISGIKTKGNVSAEVSGVTSSHDDHNHSINLVGTHDDVVFEQSNGGTGLVK